MALNFSYVFTDADLNELMSLFQKIRETFLHHTVNVNLLKELNLFYHLIKNSS